MTISYSDNYFRILFLWHGSVYKAVLKEAVVFLLLWYLVFFLNEFVLPETGREILTEFSEKTGAGLIHIPLSFLLGFFVNNGLERWWQQAQLIEKLRIERLLSTIDGSARHLEHRLTLLCKIGRWANLMCALAWRRISYRTKKRFPTDRHLVDAGLMTEAELERFEMIENRHGKWIVPFYWMVNRLKQEKEIEGEEYKAVNKAVICYHEYLRSLLNYDWLKIPVLYVQIATIATYLFMFLSVFSNQNHLDYGSLMKPEQDYNYFPLFGFIKVVFFMGWLKVGQFLSNPFGEDDDDFEMNYILDRNIHSTWLFVKQSSESIPQDDPDHYSFGSIQPLVPHTNASIKIKDIEPPIHTDYIKLSKRDSETVVPENRDDVYVDPRDIRGGVGLVQRTYSKLMDKIGRKNAAQGDVSAESPYDSTP